MGVRQLIASELSGYHWCGEIEANESYLGVYARAKEDVEWGGKVYTAIIPSVHDETLIPIIEKSTAHSIIYNDHIQGL